MPFELTDQTIVALFAAAAAIFAAEAAYLLFASSRTYRSTVNHRLRMMEGALDREAILVQLRRERGLDAGGGGILPSRALSMLLVQSGLRLSTGRLVLAIAVIAFLSLVGAYLLLGSLAEAGLAAAGASLVLPFVILLAARAQRRKTFGLQFPDAIDIVVRSLQAGHPVAVAVSMVAREMADPVGTEFGIVADEITYGSDLETALHGLQFRVGQQDLHLFVTAVAIQASAGGSLREILQNLANVIRGRIKMRRKVRSVSAEGKTSAAILAGLPLSFFLLIQLMVPNYYGSVWHAPVVQIGLAAAGGWMLLGMAIMWKMIAFKI